MRVLFFKIIIFLSHLTPPDPLKKKTKQNKNEKNNKIQNKTNKQIT